MYETLMDATNISAIYTLYATILLSLTLKYIWTWHIEYNFIDSICTSTELNLRPYGVQKQDHHMLNSYSLLSWISRYIRRKKSTGDEPDEPLSSFYKYHQTI